MAVQPRVWVSNTRLNKIMIYLSLEQYYSPLATGALKASQQSGIYLTWRSSSRKHKLCLTQQCHKFMTSLIRTPYFLYLFVCWCPNRLTLFSNKQQLLQEVMHWPINTWNWRAHDSTLMLYQQSPEQFWTCRTINFKWMARQRQFRAVEAISTTLLKPLRRSTPAVYLTPVEPIWKSSFQGIIMERILGSWTAAIPQN